MSVRCVCVGCEVCGSHLFYWAWGEFAVSCHSEQLCDWLELIS